MNEPNAGRELDALIAEHVFGIEAFHHEQSSPGYLHYLPSDGSPGCALPRYSTDIAAAWEVFTLLVSRYADPLAITYEDGQWAVMYGFEDCRPLGSGATAPLAICRAALSVQVTA